MKEPSPANVPRRPKQDGTAFRVLGILAIAFGTLQASLLAVAFPPSPRLAPGIYIGIAMGVLGIPVFLLVRWAVVIFVLVCVTFGAILIYGSIASHIPIYEAIFVCASSLIFFAPVGLLFVCWSSLR